MRKPVTIQDKRKGAALRRRMRDQEFNQTTFAVAIHYKSRQMISKWWQGKHWPEGLEEVMESVLHLPRGFFQRIGQGVPYDNVMKFSESEERKESLSNVATEQQMAIAKQIVMLEQGLRELAEMLATVGISVTGETVRERRRIG